MPSDKRFAVLIDAGNVEGFCIVSSDSDFTCLASRLREAGTYVIGMGEKTPNAFVAACNRFTYLEVLTQALCPENPQNHEPPRPRGHESGRGEARSAPHCGGNV